MPVELELLAPARNHTVAMSAILAGADAVYMGASSHGARKEAANSIDDIRRVVDMAHPFRAKVYATVNTLVYDDEIAGVEKLIRDLYDAGVDALIVQDMGILRMDIPPIDLHASTQCDIRDAAKARFLWEAGFSRLVLARELSLDEISGIHNAVPGASLEAFIHGALCVSYSGDCRASYLTGGRSANRGECAQICRLPFTLTDASGKVLVRDKHLLSLRDLNRSDSIAAMADAGISSFKIEGRLKDECYVRNTVAWYSRILDRIVEQSGGRYSRQSAGSSRPGFNPAPERSFNRGFTTYFLNGRAPAKGVASLDTPKAVGQPVGTVSRCDGRVITARLDAPLANGDGLGYFDVNGVLRGFRLNRVEGNRLYPASPVTVPAGTRLYRNKDKDWEDTVAAARPSRTIRVDMSLRRVGTDRIALELTDERSLRVTAMQSVGPLDTAVTPQEQPRRRVLDKLGGTIYRAGRIVDIAGDCFIPASALTALRRKGIELLDNTAAMTYPRIMRRHENKNFKYVSDVVTFRDNISNHLAESFYRDHGVTDIQHAVEIGQPVDRDTIAMCTRYCIRREMGKCLLTPAGKEWPSGPMYLDSGRVRLRVEFDCRRCGMNLFTLPPSTAPSAKHTRE